MGLGNVVGEYDGTGNLVAHYDHGYGLLARVDGGGNAVEYTFDAIGNTHELVAASINIANRYAYDPFGTVLRHDETIANPFQFVGRLGVMQENSAVSYLRARYYETGLGRFLSSDPLGLMAGDANLYRYARNRPLKAVDPSGRFTLGGEVGPVEGSIGFDPATGALVVCAGGTSGLGAWALKDDKGNINAGFSGEAFGLSFSTDTPSEGAYSQVWGGLGVAVAGSVSDSGPSSSTGIGLGGTASVGGCINLTHPRRRPPPPPPPGPPSGPGGGGASGAAGSLDPNQKTGPSGYGTGGYLPADSLFAYRVDFENATNATAPAQIVTVTDQLDSDLDWSTFELTEIGFGDHLVPVPAHSQYFETIVPMSYNGVDFEVWIYAGIDQATGQVYAQFYTIDPATELPPDVTVGFLPPEDGTGRGQGHITYLIRAKPGLSTGTAIRNVAVIEFDRGEVIATNQRNPHDPSAGTDPAKESLNTIDAVAPSSAVSSLPPTVPLTFNVQWSGTDDAGGAGVRDYTIYVADNGGAFTPWLFYTTATTAAFTGQDGHTYTFYSVARDNVGNLERAPSAPDASTTVSQQSCTFSIAPTSLACGAAPTNGTVNVSTSPGCGWLATNNVGWLSITSGSTGTGNGSVVYTVDGNTTAVARVGTMTIAGKPFTVSQAAGQGTPGQLSITKLQAKLNFAKPSADSCSLKASLDPGAGFSPTGKPVTLDIGGAEVTATLDAKGRGVTASGSLKLSYAKKTGLWTLTAKMSRGSWQAVWFGHGLVDATIPKPGISVTLPVRLAVGDKTFTADKTLQYTATAGKSGSAK